MPMLSKKKKNSLPHFADTTNDTTDFPLSQGKSIPVSQTLPVCWCVPSTKNGKLNLKKKNFPLTETCQNWLLTLHLRFAG